MQQTNRRPRRPTTLLFMAMCALAMLAIGVFAMKSGAIEAINASGVLLR